MSYDIAIFEPSAVDDAGFPEWVAEQSEWSETHGYADAAVTTEALQRFLDHITTAFTPLNPVAGVARAAASDDARREEVADFCVGTQLVYVCFAWSAVAAARAACLDAAAATGVAVALVSDDGTIFRPW